MEPASIGLMLFLFCGQPVGVVVSVPKADGREVITGPVASRNASSGWTRRGR